MYVYLILCYFSEYGAVISHGDKTSVVSNISDIVRQPWFIGLIGGIIFILLTVFFIILFIRRQAALKKGLQAHLSGKVVLDIFMLNFLDLFLF